MAFKNPNNQQKSPVLWHSTLVKSGPKLVTVVTAPKMVKNGELCVIDLNVDGVKHGYFIDNEDIKEGFAKYVGHQVVLIASGDSRKGTAKMEFQLAGIPASQLPEKASPAPVTAQKSPSQGNLKTDVKPHNNEVEAKKYLCKAANLMRLCVKKANDIAIEMGLPPEHRQGIATTLFIQGDRRGFIDTMPVSAYTPEELGFGKSKATNLSEPEPEEGDDESF